jgi:hypothetical protein
MDRLDYLKRDSFFTGVSEGIIGSDRIIKMLNVVDDNLVVEEKGIYSIEKFLIARRLMYWQVYLHKTVVSAEQLIVKILQRAREIAKIDKDLFVTPALKFFLYRDDVRDLSENILMQFMQLDDYDIITSIKIWQSHNDYVLSKLSRSLINRELFKIEYLKQPFDKETILLKKEETKKLLNLKEEDLKYFVFNGEISNNAYSSHDDKINILLKNGKLIDIAEASDMLNVSVLSQKVKKHFICYPKL